MNCFGVFPDSKLLGLFLWSVLDLDSYVFIVLKFLKPVVDFKILLLLMSESLSPLDLAGEYFGMWWSSNAILTSPSSLNYSSKESSS